MATLINLRWARKVKAREQRAEAAAEQRLRHGRSTSEKQASETRLAREAAVLEGHRLGTSHVVEGTLNLAVTK